MYTAMILAAIGMVTTDAITLVPAIKKLKEKKGE